MASVACACSAPDGRELFLPFEPTPGRAGGAGGAAGEGSVAPGASGAGVNEGQGGSGFTPAGAGGQPGTGAEVLADAAVDDAAELDAGLSSDALAPAPCSANREVCDGLDNDCDTETDPAGTCAEGCAGFALLGRGYMFCSDAVTRAVALGRCEVQGMRLAWIETPEENASLVSSLEQADVPAAVGNPELLTQIGGSDAGAEGQWFWTGSAVAPGGVQFWQGAAAGTEVDGAYQNWSAPEPNDSAADEDCAVISVFGGAARAPGQWDDRSCDLTIPFVCEQP